MRNLEVNGERLWASLMELAKIGATEKVGVCRLAASDLDGLARRLTAGATLGVRRQLRRGEVAGFFAKLAPAQIGGCGDGVDGVTGTASVGWVEPKAKPSF